MEMLSLAASYVISKTGGAASDVNLSKNSICVQI